MERRILGGWRALGAMLFSMVLVIGTYMFVRGVETPPVAQASIETALLQAIATKDSDGDGLPDWEETLYGTDSHTIDTFHLGMTDGEAVSRGLVVPKAIANITTGDSIVTDTNTNLYTDVGLTPPSEGTLTDVFAKNFFEQYLVAKAANGGADLTSSQTDALAEQAMDRLSQNFAPSTDFKTAKDIKVAGSGPDALRTFAAAAELVFKKNVNSATTSEIQYLKNAVMNDDATALTQLAMIAKSNRETAFGLSVLPVPQELAGSHLALVNSLARMSEINSDFARINVDPIAAILALQQYSQTEKTLGDALASISATYSAENVAFPVGAQGAAFLNFATYVATKQAGSTEL